MPEGHTIHRLASDQVHLVGRRVVAGSPQGRFTEGATAIDGCVLEEVDAYGKHLLHRYGGSYLHVHLGTAGVFLRIEARHLPARPQVRLRLDFGNETWDLIAPMRCEILPPEDVQVLLASLGPDPLRPEARPEEVWDRLRRHRGSVAVALLDQSVLAGVGNVFRAEALAACRISPRRPARELSVGDFDCLWQTLQTMMVRAVGEGRIVTVDAPPGSDIPESEARYVYKQRVCRRCGDDIETWSPNGRTAYSCPTCQPA